MATFLCKIGTTDGRILEKEFESVSSQQLNADLAEQGFYVLSVKKKPWSFLTRHSQCRLPGRHFLTFNQELLALLRSGLPIIQVLDTLTEKMEPGAFREAVEHIREEIRSGATLSDAFEKFPVFFPSLYVAAIRAGEKTGDLPETLSRYMVYRKKIEEIKAKVRNASFYPILLTSAALIVVVFLLFYVVPTFTQIYADANVQLPLMTRVLIEVSSLMTELWYLFLIFLWVDSLDSKRC